MVFCYLFFPYGHLYRMKNLSVDLVAEILLSLAEKSLKNADSMSFIIDIEIN